MYTGQSAQYSYETEISLHIAVGNERNVTCQVVLGCLKVNDSAIVVFSRIIHIKLSICDHTKRILAHASKTTDAEYQSSDDLWAIIVHLAMMVLSLSILSSTQLCKWYHCLPLRERHVEMHWNTVSQNNESVSPLYTGETIITTIIP